MHDRLELGTLLRKGDDCRSEETGNRNKIYSSRMPTSSLTDTQNDSGRAHSNCGILPHLLYCSLLQEASSECIVTIRSDRIHVPRAFSCGWRASRSTRDCSTSLDAGLFKRMSCRRAYFNVDQSSVRNFSLPTFYLMRHTHV